MLSKNRLLQALLLCLSIVLVLSCTLLSNSNGEQPDPSIAETDIALRVMSTSLANEVMTVQAKQTRMAVQVPETQATQTSTSQPLPSPLPTQTNPPPSPLPTQTDVPSPIPLVLDIHASVKAFYCYQPPYELTITVKVSDIERGMAVYYHIQDKNSGVTSDGQVIDLRRKDGDTRSATIIGGGSIDQNLQFPPLMDESYFIYQIISDDGSYRSPTYSDITFFPCAQ
jgi:hypothetical protein